MNTAFFILILSGCTLAVTGCKTVKETPSGRPAKTRTQSDENATAVEPSMVVASSPVPLDKIPAVAVTVDVSGCLGAGKWYDPSRPATPNPGAISLTLNSSTPLAAGEAQPEAMYFEPVKKFASATTNSPVQAYTWRVKAGRYTLNLVALSVDTNKVESRISTPVDLADGTERKFMVKGVWTSSSTCSLEFQL